MALCQVGNGSCLMHGRRGAVTSAERQSIMQGNGSVVYFDVGRIGVVGNSFILGRYVCIGGWYRVGPFGMSLRVKCGYWTCMKDGLKMAPRQVILIHSRGLYIHCR